MPRPCFIVHDLAQARAALAAAEADTGIVLASAPGAAGYLGAGYWRALEDRLRAEFPAAGFLGLLDCGESAGDALAALRAGVKAVRLSGPAEAVARVSAIAAEQGALVIPETGLACDLGAARDPLATARKHLADVADPSVEKAAGPG